MPISDTVFLGSDMASMTPLGWQHGMQVLLPKPQSQRQSMRQLATIYRVLRFPAYGSVRDLTPRLMSDSSVEQSESLPRTMFVVYPDADEGFWNDDADGFDAEGCDRHR